MGGVFGRQAGTAEGFDYTPAMRASRLVWDDRTLDLFLADPPAVVPGSAMDRAITGPQARGDIIAYLKTLR